MNLCSNSTLSVNKESKEKELRFKIERDYTGRRVCKRRCTDRILNHNKRSKVVSEKRSNKDKVLYLKVKIELRSKTKKSMNIPTNSTKLNIFFSSSSSYDASGESSDNLGKGDDEEEERKEEVVDGEKGVAKEVEKEAEGIFCLEKIVEEDAACADALGSINLLVEEEEDDDVDDVDIKAFFLYSLFTYSNVGFSIPLLLVVFFFFLYNFVMTQLFHIFTQVPSSFPISYILSLRIHSRCLTIQSHWLLAKIITMHLTLYLLYAYSEPSHNTINIRELPLFVYFPDFPFSLSSSSSLPSLTVPSFLPYYQ